MALNTSSYGRLSFWLLAAAMLFLVWQIGYRYGQGHPSTEPGFSVQHGKVGSGVVAGDPQEQVDLSLLWETVRALQESYITPDDIRMPAILYGAIDGAVSAVGDPYTVFMTPKQNEEFHDGLEGHLEGIGAELQMKDKLIVVVSPLKRSPAERAGIRPGDIVLEANGTSLEGKSLFEAIQLIRGPKGTKVTLKVARVGSDLLTFEIIRESITIPSVEAVLIERPGATIGHVSLNQFGDNSMDEMEKALTAWSKLNLRALILDLRSNGGGYLDGSVDLTSMFLESGDVVRVDRRGEEPETLQVSGNTIFPAIPMVVLVNQGTASAAEITAGALQDAGRAKIIGMKTFGKGTVQEVIDLSGGSSLRVTVAHWFTPKGKNLAKEGIDPDIVIDRTAEEIQAEKDPQLDAAVIWLLEKRDVTKKI